MALQRSFRHKNGSEQLSFPKKKFIAVCISKQWMQAEAFLSDILHLPRKNLVPVTKDWGAEIWPRQSLPQ
jgi:hypothetical protein